MPEKSKTFHKIIFTPEVIIEAVNKLSNILPDMISERYGSRKSLSLPSGESWQYDNDAEFYADYRKGFISAVYNFSCGDFYQGSINLSSEDDKTSISVRMPSRADVETIFNIFERNINNCRLPDQKKNNIEHQSPTQLLNEIVNNIETHCPIVTRKIRLALQKLDSNDSEEWQNANMLMRDAWIELLQWLCQITNVDTSDISPDAVIDRLNKLNIKRTDERVYNLARSAFGLYAEHHNREINKDTSTACVISSIVSIKTIIREVLNA